jgi:hypothetical protein
LVFLVRFSTFQWVTAIPNKKFSQTPAASPTHSLPFSGSIERRRKDAGHLSGPVDQRAQGADLRAIVRLTALMAVAHQPGLLEDPKMLRDRRLRDPGLSRQRPNRLLAFAAKALENRAPRRVGERPEEPIVSVLHVGSITVKL